MLDLMHPMSLRRTGSFREGEHRPLDAVAMGRIVAPTLILHAKDDTLVVYEHAEHAHRSIKQSTLVLFGLVRLRSLSFVVLVRLRSLSFVVLSPTFGPIPPASPAPCGHSPARCA
jgi:pimeloyl-ACP methyl ester carboxylesterase